METIYKMFKNASGWLEKSWWGIIPTYFIVFGGCFGLIWTFGNPLGISGQVTELPEILKYRFFYHIIITLIIAAHITLFLDLYFRKKHLFKKIEPNNELFTTLRNIQSRIDIETVQGLSSLEIETIQKSEIQPKLTEMLRSKKYTKLHVIGYSLISNKLLEEDIEYFLKNGGSLKVLMLDPNSIGFKEKTILESFRGINSNLSDDEISKWKTFSETTQKSHKEHIQSNVSLLNHWKDLYKNRITYRLYSDTPNFRIFMFDRKSILISSYFYNPISSGHDNPHVFIDSSEINVLSRIISNWFDVKYATGRQP